ncbi:hypothetical protein EXIGLDRAFT_775330 [Exidia glandulosa HHB12029]|uniref:Uncharacterized protein n=1 Tax=Exidia glandulosa HHB12029 TaxID=1314781 RepID=A0A165DYJ9_EXIGL|nr:hypothetical protein EXIGLDRAFT_775330 [Exidia glandulosa HHB12029]
MLSPRVVALALVAALSCVSSAQFVAVDSANITTTGSPAARAFPSPGLSCATTGFNIPNVTQSLTFNATSNVTLEGFYASTAWVILVDYPDNETAPCPEGAFLRLVVDGNPTPLFGNGFATPAGLEDKPTCRSAVGEGSLDPRKAHNITLLTNCALSVAGFFLETDITNDATKSSPSVSLTAGVSIVLLALFASSA